MIKIDWQAGPGAQVSEADLLKRGAELLEGTSGSLVIDNEHVDHMFQAADSVLQASYTTNTVLHFQLEPVNAIGLQKNGRWELHTATNGSR